jgi:glycosyltransferase involved in cell wall biosynthesis
LLLIGPADHGDRLVGGATASFRAFLDEMDRDRVAYRLIDTRRFSGRLHALPNIVYLLLRLGMLLHVTRIIALFAARGGILTLGPMLYLLARLTRVRFCLRPFGGDFLALYQDAPAWHRMILRRTILRSDVLLLQTRSLVRACDQLARHPVWFPNSRPRPAPAFAHPPYRKRFVFLSQVTEEKGVGVLLDALDLLDDSFTLDVYGPLLDRALGQRLERRGCYRGVVPREKVTATLRGYDILVLPTFTPHEGYPGAILEAYAVGIPVITTQWLSIPEIVQDGVSGLLVPPRSAHALAAAMRSVDQASLTRLCDGATRAFDAFESGRVSRDALDAILGPTG